MIDYIAARLEYQISVTCCIAEVDIIGAKNPSIAAANLTAAFAGA
jgi:hypothetical protein